MFPLSSLVIAIGFMSIPLPILELQQFSFTRDREIENTPIWVLSDTWQMGEVRDTRFGTNVSKEINYWILQVLLFLSY